MKAILIANPKGGSGKTTLATNLAGSLAVREQKVFLSDLDRQQSSLKWLAMRSADRAVIHRLDTKDDDDAAIPHPASSLILDSAAGLHGQNLAHAVKIQHKIIVSGQPSVVEM